jgi:outer membrane murein-binding lipoprotein Lpp
MTEPATKSQRDILIKIGEKQDRMSIDITDIKAKVDDLSDCQRENQLAYAKEHEIVVGEVKRANARIDELAAWRAKIDERITVMEKLLERQYVINAILTFVSTVLGAAVISYIADLILH